MGWTLDRSRGVWIVDNYSELNYAAINNFAEYGEPFSPYEHPGWIEDYSPDFSNIIIEMPQSSVMSHGYGKSIRVKDFPIVNRFINGMLPLLDATYEFTDLESMGVAKKDDRTIGRNVYPGLSGYIDAGELPASDAAYIHGTVGFALMANTSFIQTSLGRRVNAEIGALDDKWDFHSGTIPDYVNAAVAALVGPDHYSLTKPIKIKYKGRGKHDVFTAFDGAAVSGACRLSGPVGMRQLYKPMLDIKW